MFVNDATRIRRILTISLAAAVLSNGRPLFADDTRRPELIAPARHAVPTTSPADAPPAKEVAENDPLAGPALKDSANWSEMLRAVVLTAIPDKYEDLRHWGNTNEVFAGVKVQQRGFNIRVSERKREVNHGAWHRYKIELIDPKQHLKLIFHQIETVAVNEYRFQVRLASKLRCRGDFEHWVLGVKGFNATVVSEADVEIIATCRLAIRTESTAKHLLPDLALDPHVDSVKLFLRNLDVKRIGEIRGDLAEGIGDLSRHDIENLLQAQENRVVKKANEAIDKKRNSLRLPSSKLW